MQTINLSLTSPKGDEIGRLRLDDVVVAQPGEAGASERPRLDEAMTHLTDRIGQAVASERMAISLDALDLRIAVSRALMAPTEGDEIVITVPVREAAGVTHSKTDGKKAEDPLADLNALFDLNEETGGEG